MISLKPKAMSETELIINFQRCLMSVMLPIMAQKFVRLLNDYIPYQTGLKTRLELLGKSGAIEQMTKIKKDALKYIKSRENCAQFSQKVWVYIRRELSYAVVSGKALQLNHFAVSPPRHR